jgi:hypothetical protein
MGPPRIKQYESSGDCEARNVLNLRTEARFEETLDPEDRRAMRALGHRILDDAMDYLETLRDRPVRHHVPPGSTR